MSPARGQRDAAERYEESRAWLYGLARGGVKLGLERIEEIAAALAHPEAFAPAVIVAGTNGKGSVSAMIHGALVAARVRAGLFTSPHLHTVRERIRLGRAPISETAFVREVDRLRAVVATGACPEPTFFEAITALGWSAMRSAKIELEVLEVGLGGRLDATNATKNVHATAITSIGMDHEAYLGSTIERIAREKAGILRRGVPAVVSVDDRGALREIRRIARQRGAKLFVVGEDVQIDERPDGMRVTIGRRRIGGLVPGLAGAHQRRNAAIAAATLLLLRSARQPIPDDAIRRGIGRVDWPGRLERVEGTPSLLFDAAHNPDGALALAAHLSALRSTESAARRRVLLFGVMADKDWPAMLRTLSPEIDERVYVAPALGRAEKLVHLDAFAPGLSAASVAEGLALAKARAGANGLVVVAGSIFVLAEARAAALGIAQEPPIAM
ncbi:MAG: Mur ligase family protein [Sandaracinus sp.]